MPKKEKNEVSRRSFLKSIGTAVVGLAVGAGIGYGTYPTINPSAAEKTVTITTGDGAPVGVYSIPVEGKETHERLMNAMKYVAERDGLKGKELVVMHPGGGSVAYDSNKEEFERETGVKLTHAEAPIGEIFEKVMLEAVSKTGEYDVFSQMPHTFGDLAESGLIAPLDDYVKWFDNRFYGMPDGYIYPLDHIMSEYQGKIYGIVQDGDVWTNYINTQMLNDSSEQEGFETQYGYPLKIADTFEEYLDLGEYFTRPDEGRFGIVELRNPTRAYLVWHVYYSSKRYPTMLPFDEDMNPLINGNEGIKATEEFIDATKYMPQDVLNWEFAVVYATMGEGIIFESIEFPSMSNLLNDPERSKIVGNWTAAAVPGSKVTGPAGKEIILKRTVQGPGWSLNVSNYSKMKDFAALYCMWLTSPEKSAVAVSAKGSWMDPCRYNHAGESADPRVLEARGVIIPPFLKNASIAVPVVGSGIRGGNEYATTLSRNVHAAMQGTMDATESMERTAEEWDEITDRIGREKQIDAWRAYMKFYPTAIV